MSGYFKLRLSKLNWLSSVDEPAQGDGARALLLKRDGETAEVTLTARVVKQDDELGLVFGHAFAASLDGGKTEHVDVQNDAITPDFLKTAMEFVEAGGPTDVNHDGSRDGRVVFAWPLIPEVNDALGIKSDVIGLAVAVKPSPETYKRFKSGELRGFSIAGIGERVQTQKLDEKCPDCGESLGDRHECSAAKSTRVSGSGDGARMETKIVVLTEAQHAHYIKLAGAEAEAFLVSDDRDAIVAKALAADPVVFTGTASGITLRKSEATPFALGIAKVAEHQAEIVAKQKAEIAKANEQTEIEKQAREMVELKKRASDALPNFAGSDDTRAALFKAAELIGDDAVKALKGYDSVSALKTETAGIDGDEQKPTQNEQELFDAAVVAQLTADGVADPSKPSPAEKSKATATLLNTTKGAALYAAVQKRIKAGKGRK